MYVYVLSVCCACVLKWLCVCVESGMCVLCGVGVGVGVQCVVCGVCACCIVLYCMCSTCARVAGTHGGVVNLHTGGFSLFLSFCRPFFFLSLFRRSSFSLSLVLSLLSSLLSSVSSFSATMTMITRSVGSFCVHTALTCLSVNVRGLRSIHCLANMLASCKKQLSWYNCASLVPLGMKWACICAGKG